MTRPSPSTPAPTGDICGRPSTRRVDITARWCTRRKSRAWSGVTPTGSGVAARAATLVVLVDDGRGVPVRDAVLVAQPVDALVEAEESWTGFESLKPLGEVTTGGLWHPVEELLVGGLGVVQGHRAPPYCRSVVHASETASHPGRSTSPAGQRARGLRGLAG